MNRKGHFLSVRGNLKSYTGLTVYWLFILALARIMILHNICSYFCPTLYEENRLVEHLCSSLPLHLFNYQNWHRYIICATLASHFRFRVLCVCLFVCSLAHVRVAFERSTTPLFLFGDPWFRSPPKESNPDWGLSLFFSLPPDKFRDIMFNLTIAGSFNTLSKSSSSSTNNHIHDCGKSRETCTRISRRAHRVDRA